MIFNSKETLCSNLKIKVKYEVRKTSLGQGVFVLEPVKQGTLIWRCKDTIDQLFYFMNDQKENNCVRYRMGENVVCFRGKEETLAHLENLSSYEDRLPKNFSKLDFWFH